jgi:hypothetical protein
MIQCIDPLCSLERSSVINLRVLLPGKPVLTNPATNITGGSEKSHDLLIPGPLKKETVFVLP